MAKSKREIEKVARYSLPSFFGSHKSMVNQEETDKLNDPKLVVCKDEFGFYTTEANRLDCGCADPNRYQTKRLDSLLN